MKKALQTVRPISAVLWRATQRTTQILFEERFENAGSNLSFGFDGWVFGYTNRTWDRSHVRMGGVNNGSFFRATATFESLRPADTGPIGANYYFTKTFSGTLADHSREFWVRQCMRYKNGFIDAHVLPAENPKINYFIGDGGGHLNYTSTSVAIFTPGERVVSDSARADIFSSYQRTDLNRESRVTNVVGTFQPGRTIRGVDSGATPTFIDVNQFGA